MTTKEFNEKYKDYIEEGHYGLAINIKEVANFLDKIFQTLVQIPNFKFTQIKLKFGYCRFYSNLSPEFNHCVELGIDKIIYDNTIINED